VIPVSLKDSFLTENYENSGITVLHCNTFIVSVIFHKYNGKEKEASRNSLKR
jgi:hypothetical protein